MEDNTLNIPAEPLRLQVKELAEEVRLKFARKGLADIFDILSEVAFLLRKPLEIEGLSGFCTFFEGRLIVYLNSNFTLGHERFTGAHELYHLLYNSETIKKEKLLFEEAPSPEEDEKADIFAAEFLMPEDYVKEKFHKVVNVDQKDVQPRHVIRMHNLFKVSYKAMLKRLIQLGLCSRDRYGELVLLCSIDKKDELQSLTRKEGYDIDLIIPSKVSSVPQEYIEFIKSNYENRYISYKNMANCFNFIGLDPARFGYEYPEEGDNDEI